MAISSFEGPYALMIMMMVDVKNSILSPFFKTVGLCFENVLGRGLNYRMIDRMKLATNNK